MTSSLLSSPLARTLSRRKVLLGAGGVGAAALVGPRLAFASPSNPASGDAVVVIMLNGAADGLSMAPPHGYDSYRSLRPTLAIPPPGERNGALPLDSSNTNAIFPTGIDGVVGLRPALAPLYETMWNSGNLAVIPAAGLPAYESSIRSHFQAQQYWERGSASNSVQTGWLNRALSVQDATNLPGVGTFSQSQDILAGSAKTAAIPDIKTYELNGWGEANGIGREALNAIHAATSGAIANEGVSTLSVLDAVGQLDPDPTRLRYPATTLGTDLADIAVLLRSGLGLKAAAVNFGGWDHHDDQGAPGNEAGRFHSLAAELGAALRAFTDDLASDGSLNEVSVLVLTEFGRTINENGSRGTDHGRGTTIMAMGGGIQGGVFGNDFPDVIENDPQDGDLTIFTDFRQPVSEILANRVGVGNVFPTFAPPETAMGITRSS